MDRRSGSGSDPEDRRDPAPESAMGGASDFGAHGGHPASHADAAREGRPAEPERAPGDAAVERRHHRDPNYRGPERRMGPGFGPTEPS